MTPSTTDIELRQAEFEQAVVYSLHLWPSLSLAVQNSWGGPDSSDKRDWFAGAIVDLFPPFTKTNQASAEEAQDAIDAAYVEEVLLQVMVDEFDVNVDDDSSLEVAENIIRAREQLAVGRFDEVKRLRERFAKLKGSTVEQMFSKGDDQQDTDWEDEEDEEDDEDMEEAPALVEAPRERREPEVDEEGFTKVTRKKR